LRLFVFGLGYTALAFIRSNRGWFAAVEGTVRSREKAARLAAEGIDAWLFDGAVAGSDRASAIRSADAVLICVPPGRDGDPVLAAYGAALARSPRLAWIGYLSTVGVYGDHGGAWVDETTPCAPSSDRSRERLKAEQAWLDFGAASGMPVQVFRLAGIYGPGRNALVNLAAGTARRIVKPGQVFNRIHVADIAAVLAASLVRPRAGALYNVADGEPAPPQDVVAFAAALAGIAPPPEQEFKTAALGAMAASFYGENKRVANRLIREELGVTLAYPSYREGLRALRAAGEGP
jgi:nucleoside-diphosphate-sugar epimerase